MEYKFIFVLDDKEYDTLILSNDLINAITIFKYRYGTLSIIKKIEIK